MKNYKIIGLTGQSGAGKSTAAGYFLSKGAAVINADLIVKELYQSNSPCVKALAAVFGKDIIDTDGTPNRPLLAKRAFSSKENTEMLNSVVHPFVIALLLKKIKTAAKSGSKLIVFDAPQLFESNIDVLCDCIISVVASRQKRIERICKRDLITVLAAEQRINAQYSESFFIENSDYIIENNSDKESLERQIKQTYELICRGD